MTGCSRTSRAALAPSRWPQIAQRRTGARFVGGPAITDHECRLERFETLASECELIAKLATDGTSCQPYLRLALSRVGHRHAHGDCDKSRRIAIIFAIVNISDALAPVRPRPNRLMSCGSAEGDKRSRGLCWSTSGTPKAVSSRQHFHGANTRQLGCRRNETPGQQEPGGAVCQHFDCFAASTIADTPRWLCDAMTIRSHSSRAAVSMMA